MAGKWSNDRAESALLGRCLRLPGDFDVAMGLIQVSDFRLPAHAMVWAAMCELRGCGRPLSHDGVIDVLTHQGQVEACGVPAAFEEWEVLAERVRSVEAVARIVSDNARARRVESALEESKCYSSDAASVDEFVTNAIATVTKASEQVNRVDLFGLDECATEFLKDLEARRDASYVRGVSTGLLDLDAYLNGLETGLHVLAARPSVGKTALALNVAKHAAEKHGPVLFFSLEMSKRVLYQRMACAETGIDWSHLRKGGATDEQLIALDATRKTLGRLPIRIADTFGVTVHGIRSIALRENAKKKLALVVIDYLQLITPTQRSGSKQTRQELVAEMSRELKGLSKDLQCPILLLAQLNRGVESEQREPRMSDLRESGAIEQDADTVMILHRPQLDTALTKCVIAKQREGRTGAVNLSFEGEKTTFQNYTGRTEPDGDVSEAMLPRVNAARRMESRYARDTFRLHTIPREIPRDPNEAEDF